MNAKLKSTIQGCCPPIVWEAVIPRISKIRQQRFQSKRLKEPGTMEGKNDELYWDEEFAAVLDKWGEGNAWHEIEYLLSDRKGRILDIACGTGRVMDDLMKYTDLDIYGCDYSDLLIRKAHERGIDSTKLKVCDARETGYEDAFFDIAYSIGSLEHFTEAGISEMVEEGSRIVKGSVYHQVPTSRSGENEGWIQPLQSYHNNSVDWWVEKFLVYYDNVEVLTSLWEDANSVGKWFICKRRKVS